MKKLTFDMQIVIGIICMFLGFTLSIATEIKGFSNIGACIYGLIFVINPVEPDSYKGYPNLKRWIRLCGILVIILEAVTHFNW